MAERGAKETRPCIQCGKPKTVLVSQVPRMGPLWLCDSACRAAYRITHGIKRASRGGTVSITCLQCGVTMDRFRSLVKEDRQSFCSKRCRAIFQGKARKADGTWNRPTKPKRGDEQPCGACGRPVYRAASYPTGKARYCSNACHDISQRVDSLRKPCDQCGTIMVLRPSEWLRRFCNRACEYQNRLKRSDGRVINGHPVLINAQGYVTIFMPDHPSAGKHAGRVLEHRIVMEGVIGRLLRRDEQVHHIDGVKTNNAPENLEILSPGEHTRRTVEITMARHLSDQEQLAEYRKRFGPLI